MLISVSSRAGPPIQDCFLAEGIKGRRVNLFVIVWGRESGHRGDDGGWMSLELARWVVVES